MKRRTVLAGLGATGLASLSGCLGLVGMADHESSPAGVDATVRSETGYEQTAVDDIGVEEEVGVSALTETISVTNYLTEHEKAVDMGVLGRARGALFMVLTTPQIGVAGRNFNPVEDMTAAELVDLVEDNYDDIGNITPEDEAEITILEQSTTRSRFSADATFEGHDLEVDLQVSEAVEAGEDLLVTIGVYPRYLRSREEANVLALMEGVTADLDEDADDGNEGGDGDDEESGTDGNEDEDGEDDETSDDGDDSDAGDEDERDGENGEDGGEDGDGSDDGGVLGLFE